MINQPQSVHVGCAPGSLADIFLKPLVVATHSLEDTKFPTYSLRHVQGKCRMNVETVHEMLHGFFTQTDNTAGCGDGGKTYMRLYKTLPLMTSSSVDSFDDYCEAPDTPKPNVAMSQPKPLTDVYGIDVEHWCSIKRDIKIVCTHSSCGELQNVEVNFAADEYGENAFAFSGGSSMPNDSEERARQSKLMGFFSLACGAGMENREACSREAYLSGIDMDYWTVVAAMGLRQSAVEFSVFKADSQKPSIDQICVFREKAAETCSAENSITY